jgi:5-methylthioribose kinase
MNEVIFTTDTIIKKGDPKLMRIEFEKQTKGYILANESGLFRVPEVYDYDAISGTLVMERINNLLGIGKSISKSEVHNDLITKSGIALAYIHDNLELPNKMIIPLEKTLNYSGNKVFIHGDFSIRNVCFVNEEELMLTIIDWQMTNRHGGKSTYGTRYFDLAWFINNLFSKPICNYIGNQKVALTAERFLISYINASRKEFSVVDFSKYLQRFYLHKMEKVKKGDSLGKTLLLSYGYYSWRRFIESIN